MDYLIWYLKNIAQQVVQMIPCMAFTLILWGLIRPLRIRRLLDNNFYSPRRREICLLVFILFCSGLCALTIFPYGLWEEIIAMLFDPTHRPNVHFPSLADSLTTLKELPNSITPFREILRVGHGGPWLWFVLWGNIGMFIPIGFFLPLLWRNKRWYHAAFTGAVFSFVIEFIQIFVGRVSDIDDLMLNTTGSILGFMLYCMACKVIPLKWDLFHCQRRENA